MQERLTSSGKQRKSPNRWPGANGDAGLASPRAWQLSSGAGAFARSGSQASADGDLAGEPAAKRPCLEGEGMAMEDGLPRRATSVPLQN